MSIKVENISKSFQARRKGEDRLVVLKDISFDVNDGEFVSLLGPSGTGNH